MGLDGVEFLMAIEEAFGIHIPDAAALAIRTPREVIEYVHGHLPQAGDAAGICLTQRAFYRLREILTDWLCLGKWQIRPGSQVDELISDGQRDTTWRNVGRVFGARNWPVVGGEGWLRNPFKPRVTTMRQAAEYLATRLPMAVKNPDEGWARSEIAWIVGRLIRDQLGIHEYQMDDEFVKDLGVE